MNVVDWSRAQDLLIKLVQILSPLTVRAIPASFFLNKRFFIPPSQREQHLSLQKRTSILLLTNLAAVQKEMGEWLEEAPVVMRGVKSLTKEENAEASKTRRETSKAGKKSTPKSVPTKTETSPLSKQAQKLISQVHDAIGKLSTSAHFKDPQEGPLREALKKLKPHLDRIIETISDEEAQNLTSSRLPKSPREHLFNRLSPQMVPEKSRLSSSPRDMPRRTPSAHGQLTDSQKPASKSLEKTHPDKKRGEEAFLEPTTHKSTQSKVQVVNILTGRILVSKETSEDASAPRPVERTYLSGAPYQPETKNLISSRKKKKRKGFWFKKEEEKERDPSE